MASAWQDDSHAGEMDNPKNLVQWALFATELGTSFHRRRMELGLSQEQVAFAAGISRYTYQKFEKGESRPGTPANPSLQNVLALCQVFGVTLIEILPKTTPDLSDR